MLKEDQILCNHLCQILRIEFIHAGSRNRMLIFALAQIPSSAASQIYNDRIFYRVSQPIPLSYLIVSLLTKYF